MNFADKIGRRDFLKKGVCWGLLAGLLPFWSKAGGEQTASDIRPAPARHWRKLAG